MLPLHHHLYDRIRTLVEKEREQDAKRAEAEWERMKFTAKKDRAEEKIPNLSFERFVTHDEESVGHSPTPSLLGEAPINGVLPPLPTFTSATRSSRRWGKLSM